MEKKQYAGRVQLHWRFNGLSRQTQKLVLCGTWLFFFLLFNEAFTNPETVSTTSDEYDFDPSFLMGNKGDGMLKHFSRSRQLPVGDYLLDVYINGMWKGKKTISFTENIDSRPFIDACFSQLTLMDMDIKTMGAERHNHSLTGFCKPLSYWVPDASYQLDSSHLRLDLSIPQIALKKNPRGYIDPAYWDKGITALNVAYYLNFHQLEFEKSREGSQHGESSDSIYLRLNTALNMDGWQFRHDTSLAGRDDKDAETVTAQSYLKTAFSSIGSALTLGETYSSNHLLETVSFRGVKLVSDDRMLPDSLSKYAPRIEGNTDSNALVEVRQQGQILYQSTVAPGRFVINDLYPTGYGGDLEVSIYEADGLVKRYPVPYVFSDHLLRPGTQRYTLHFGQVREARPYRFFDGSYHTGINNHYSVYSAVRVLQHNRIFVGGIVFAAPFGALSLDWTHSVRKRLGEKQSGQRYRLGLSRYNIASYTQWSMHFSHQEASGFHSLGEMEPTLQVGDLNGIRTPFRRPRNVAQLNINQSVGQSSGTLSASVVARDFWFDGIEERHAQLSYHFNWGATNIGFSASYTGNQTDDDSVSYGLRFSLPLGSGRRKFNVTGSAMYDHQGNPNQRIGLGTSAGSDNTLSLQSHFTSSSHQSTTGVGGQYRSPWSTLSASASFDDEFHQSSAGISGSMLLHRGGINWMPQQAQTMVLVEADGAEGAIVNNQNNIRVDASGYALLPFVTPYRSNRIALDLADGDEDIALKNNVQHIVPYAGVISRVRFETIQGKAFIINSRQMDGKALPFGADVMDESGRVVTFVGQGSRIYLRSNQPHLQLTVKWFSDRQHACNIKATLSGQRVRADTINTIQALCR